MRMRSCIAMISMLFFVSMIVAECTKQWSRYYTTTPIIHHSHMIANCRVNFSSEITGWLRDQKFTPVTDVEAANKTDKYFERSFTSHDHSEIRTSSTEEVFQPHPIFEIWPMIRSFLRKISCLFTDFSHLSPAVNSYPLCHLENSSYPSNSVGNAVLNNESILVTCCNFGFAPTTGKNYSVNSFLNP